MKIYTKTGDKGETGLFNGTRVSKSDLRVKVYGTVDELNTIIGLARSFDPPEILNETLHKLSEMLFELGSDLATPLNPPAKFPVPRITQSHIDYLEKLIDEYDEKLPPLKNFILPGGTKCSAFLHNARTVCRRAERLAVELEQSDNLGDFAAIFLNRLSDYLFMASRMANFAEGVKDNEWRTK